jgi:hypothetical protein
VTTPPDDALLFAEIDRHARQRFVGVVILAVAAALFSLGVVFSVPMVHSGHPTAAMGTIVAVEKDAAGETWMTSEFTDAEGHTHRDRQTRAYHYARGEPEVGQPIEYFYERSARTGDLHIYPRGDRFLQWIFGVPTALFALLAVGAAWLVLRQRNLRRRLVRFGRRELAQAPSIRQRTLVLPAAGNRAQAVPMWRLQARYFEPTRSEFVDCHSEWQGTPVPELDGAIAMPPILVDPDHPRRYWLPVGALARTT